MPYDLTQKPIRVEISPEQTEHIVDFAHRVNEHYSAYGVGWQTTYRFNKNPIIPTSIMGFLGEAAVAEVLGLEFREEIFDNGDFGWDNELNGLRIQVKCGSGKQLIFHTLNHWKQTADVTVFSEFLGDRREPDKKPVFDVWGWCSRKDFMTHHKWRMFGDTKPNAYVDCWNLRTLDTLLTVRKPVASHARQDPR